MRLTGNDKRTLQAEGTQIKPEIWIGKNGLTDGIYETIENSFRTKELVKVKVLDNCKISKKEVADLLSKRLNAEIIQILGNMILLHRSFLEEQE
jgi:RNA-binding protein